MPPTRQKQRATCPRQKLEIPQERVEALSAQFSSYDCAILRIAKKIREFDQATSTRVYERAVDAYHKDPGPAMYPCLLPRDPALRGAYYARVHEILSGTDEIRTLFEAFIHQFAAFSGANYIMEIELGGMNLRTQSAVLKRAQDLTAAWTASLPTDPSRFKHLDADDIPLDIDDSLPASKSLGSTIASGVDHPAAPDAASISQLQPLSIHDTSTEDDEYWDSDEDADIDIGPMALIDKKFKFTTKKGVERKYTLVRIKPNFSWDSELYEIQFDDDDDGFTVWVDKARFDDMQGRSVPVGVSHS